MENKKYFFISLFFLIILIIIFLIIFISKNMTKKLKNGNNMDSQEIVDFILNINSYTAKIEVEVNSNKNTNKYILSQEYNTENGCVQEVIEPSNIAGVKITKKDNNLTIENTNLNLSTIYENYQELENNSLDLVTFIEKYKNNSDSFYKEENGEIIMQTTENNNKYTQNKILYINKENIIPTKLIIKDNNQKTTIFIKYNEIEFN